MMITTPLKIITMLKCDRCVGDLFYRNIYRYLYRECHRFYLVICMVIHVVSRIVKPKGNTHFLTIPADMVKDSQYPFQDGDEVEIIINPKTKTLEVRKK